MSPPTTTTPKIDTAKVRGRRPLRFESLDDVSADVAALVAAEHDGRLQQLGNWTLGQALGHLAAWIEFGYTGAPLNPPFFVRWILRLRRRSFLYGPMRAGVRIPGVPGGTLATESLPLEEGLLRFRRASERLKAEAPPMPSPALGKLSHSEAIALALRHAELHLSFFVPK